MRTTQQARLYWQCRRGLRELDYLLLGFMAQQEAHLTPAQWQQLEQLLQYPDETLLAWFYQQAEPLDITLGALIHEIRRCAHH